MRKLSAIINISELICSKAKTSKKLDEMQDLSIVKDACILLDGESIKDIISMKDFDASKYSKDELFDAQNSVAAPSYVDSHTHLVFGGTREEEYDMRLRGRSYSDIMNAGGGIAASRTMTKNESFDSLYEKSYKFLDDYLKNGVGTVEIKSGYGLDRDTEYKQLKVIEKLKKNHKIDIVSTYMGAHSVPAEMKGRAKEYLDLLLNEYMPEIKKENLAEFCDIFCEENVFSIEETRYYLEAAKKMGFKIKMHADEIVDLGGSYLAAELNAVSADHLLNISDKSIVRMKDSDTIATLLPATAFSLRHSYAPARKIIDSGIPLAVATDFNPGSCPTRSISLLIALCTLNMHMSIEETLNALTINAAFAVDRQDRVGSIEVGKQADIVIHSVDTYKKIPYNLAMNTVRNHIKKSELLF